MGQPARKPSYGEAKYTVERFIKETERIFGPYGSFSGWLGYQGVLMGIQSFQTPEDQHRDALIDAFNTYLTNLKDKNPN